MDEGQQVDEARGDEGQDQYHAAAGRQDGGVADDREVAPALLAAEILGEVDARKAVRVHAGLAYVQALAVHAMGGGAAQQGKAAGRPVFFGGGRLCRWQLALRGIGGDVGLEMAVDVASPKQKESQATRDEGDEDRQPELDVGAHHVPDGL